MDHIGHKTLRNASETLTAMENRAPAGTEFHTVKLEVNGQHGGYDLMVEGWTPKPNEQGYDEWIDREECH